MGIFKNRSPSRVAAPVTQQKNMHPFGILNGYTPLAAPQMKLYYALREAVPVIDAAIFKLVRLTGGFSVEWAATERDFTHLLKHILSSF